MSLVFELLPPSHSPIEKPLHPEVNFVEPHLKQQKDDPQAALFFNEYKNFYFVSIRASLLQVREQLGLGQYTITILVRILLFFE